MIELMPNAGVATIGNGGATAPAAGTVETWTGIASSIGAAPTTGVSVLRVADCSGSGEIIKVTNQTGVSPSITWTVVRGAEDYAGLVTPTCSHQAGFMVAPIITGVALANTFDALGAASAAQAAAIAASDPSGAALAAQYAAQAASDAAGTATAAAASAQAAAIAIAEAAGEPVWPVGCQRFIHPAALPAVTSNPVGVAYATYLAGSLGVRFSTDPSAAGAFVEWDIYMPAGTYAVQGLYAYGTNRGQIKVLLGGQTVVASLDLYSTTTACLIDAQRTVVVPTSNVQAFHLEVVGKAPSASAFNLIFSGCAITRTA